MTAVSALIERRYSRLHHYRFDKKIRIITPSSAGHSQEEQIYAVLVLSAPG